MEPIKITTKPKNTPSDVSISRKLINLYHSATSRNIKCSLSFRHLKRLLQSNKCYFTKVELNTIEGHPNQISIDRIDNTKPYTDNNTVLCSRRINNLKDNLTPNEIELLYKGLVKKGVIITKPNEKTK